MTAAPAAGVRPSVRPRATPRPAGRRGRGSIPTEGTR